MKRPATSPRRVGEAGGGDRSTSGRAVPGSRRRPRRLPRPSDCAYRALAKHLPACLESAPRFRVWSRGRPRDSLGPHWQLAPPLPGLGFCPPPCSLLRLGNRDRRALAATPHFLRDSGYDPPVNEEGAEAHSVRASPAAVRGPYCIGHCAGPRPLPKRRPLPT